MTFLWRIGRNRGPISISIRALCIICLSRFVRRNPSNLRRRTEHSRSRGNARPRRYSYEYFFEEMIIMKWNMLHQFETFSMAKVIALALFLSLQARKYEQNSSSIWYTCERDRITYSLVIMDLFQRTHSRSSNDQHQMVVHCMQESWLNGPRAPQPYTRHNAILMSSDQIDGEKPFLTVMKRVSMVFNIFCFSDSCGRSVSDSWSGQQPRLLSMQRLGSTRVQETQISPALPDGPSVRSMRVQILKNLWVAFLTFNENLSGLFNLLVN